MSAPRWIAAAALCAALVAGSAARPEAAVADEPCHAKAYEPFYDNGTVRAFVRLHCDRPFSWLYVRGKLLENGTVRNYDNGRCWGTSNCTSSPAHSNRSGNQLWCSEGYGDWASGTASLRDDSTRNCEFHGF